MRSLLLSLAVCLLAIPAQAKYGGGSGTKDDPYQIGTAGQLNAIGTDPNDWDKHFVLMADVDLKGLRGASFNMIGVHSSYGRPFSGVFNGNGKTIANLTCNKVGATSFGLFAAVQGTDALIKNLRLKGATGAVSAPQGAGGLAGGTKGQQGITGSFWDTQTSGLSTSAGGSGKTTVQMKTAATFAGWDFAGTWTIQEGIDYPRLQWEADPFPAPAPTTIEKVSGDNQGALAGRKLASPLTVCVKDQDDTGMAGIEVEFLVSEGDGTVSPASAVTDANGLASTELTLGATPGTNVVKAVVDSLSGSFQAEGLAPGYGGGSGAWDDPYLIYTAGQLYVIGTEPNDRDKHFKLMADIDLSGSSYNRAVIAPDANTAFTGTFDGGGHSISHLTIKGSGNLGLFGQLDLGGVVAGVIVLDVDISGSDGLGGFVGGLIGVNRGDVTQCRVTGSVSGDFGVGMMAGSNGGYVTQSCTAGTVTGNAMVGGLAGMNGGTVAQSYSRTTVDGGSAWIGGLIGTNSGTVVQCYSTGSVSGVFWSGGLVGSSLIGSTIASFWDRQTSAWSMSAGGTGKTTSQMHAASTFLAAGWDFADETANGTDDLWWILEGQDYPRLWWEPHN